MEAARRSESSTTYITLRGAASPRETAEPLLDDTAPTEIELVDFAEPALATASLECVLSWEGFFADRTAAVTPLSSWAGVVSREVSGDTHETLPFWHHQDQGLQDDPQDPQGHPQIPRQGIARSL